MVQGRSSSKCSRYHLRWKHWRRLAWRIRVHLLFAMIFYMWSKMLFILDVNKTNVHIDWTKKLHFNSNLTAKHLLNQQQFFDNYSIAGETLYETRLWKYSSFLYCRGDLMTMSVVIFSNICQLVVILRSISCANFLYWVVSFEEKNSLNCPPCNL